MGSTVYKFLDESLETKETPIASYINVKIGKKIM
jgi:hypothetical protein